MSSSLWDKKYAPRKLADFACTKRVRIKFQKMIDNKDIKMVRLLYGGPGHGKTTLAEIVSREIGAQWKIENFSDRTGIDYIRDTVLPYAQSASMVPGLKKIFILDEADQLSDHALKMTKKMIVDTINNCSYFITTNYIEAFDIPNLSRVTKISLIPQSKEEEKELMIEYYKRAKYILEQEKVKYDSKVLKKLIKNVYPDFRQIIMTLQDCYDDFGEINDNVLEARASLSNKLIDGLINKVEPNEMIEISNDIEPINFYYSFHNKIAEKLKPKSLSTAYSVFSFYNASHDKAINKKAHLACCLLELLDAKLEFKD